MNKLIDNYIRELSQSLDEIDVGSLIEVVHLIEKACIDGRKIFVFGNGGSASTASHLSLHLKQTEISKKKIEVSCLNDSPTLITAISNDSSYSDVFVSQLEDLVASGDLAIAISGSGDSENVLKAATYFAKCNGIVIAIVGFGGGELSRLSSHSIVLSSKNYGPVEDAHLSVVHLIKMLLDNLSSET